MTLTETMKLFYIMRGLYPRDKAFDKPKEELTRIAGIWQIMLDDVPFDVAQAAVQAVASTSQFTPSIADIRAWHMSFTGKKVLDADEAWGMVKKAVQQFGYSQPEKARDSMPIEVWRMVERIGWRDLCMSEEPGVERGQFMKMWGLHQKREQEKAVLPPAVKAIGTKKNMELVAGQ